MGTPPEPGAKVQILIGAPRNPVRNHGAFTGTGPIQRRRSRSTSPDGRGRPGSPSLAVILSRTRRYPIALIPEWRADGGGLFLGSEVAPCGREATDADGAAGLLGRHADGLGEGREGELHLGELLNVHARAHGGRDDLDGFG
jgi:hypothetical protein